MITDRTLERFDDEHIIKFYITSGYFNLGKTNIELECVNIYDKVNTIAEVMMKW